MTQYIALRRIRVTALVDGRVLGLRRVVSTWTTIRAALTSDDLRQARELVNGGSHGFDRFKDT